MLSQCLPSSKSSLKNISKRVLKWFKLTGVANSDHSLLYSVLQGFILGILALIYHHQNGRIERKHRHIVDIGLTLLAQAHLPLKFWWNAFQTAVYIINRLPTPVLNNISPYQKLFHKKPDFLLLELLVAHVFLT